MEYLVDNSKEYVMKICLGKTTTTYDAEGEVVATREVGPLSPDIVEGALDSFRGTIDQTPPMFSALKHQGKRLYQLARAGIDVERQPRRVEITHIELVEFAPPLLTLRAECGRGVYIRTLAHQVGEALGCGGYLYQLIRTRSGAFHLDDGVSLDQLEAEAQDQAPHSWQRHLKPVDFPLLHLKGAVVSRAAERLIRTGQPINLGPASNYAGYLERYRAYTADGRFLAVVRYHKSENQWKPYQVFRLETPSPYAVAPDEGT